MNFIPDFDRWLSALFWLLLVLAAGMDHRCKQVYRFYWITALPVLTGRAFLLGLTGQAIVDVLFFCLLQEWIMPAYYGRADCHCFSCCALFLAPGSRAPILLFVLLMLYSFLLLGICAAFAGNIGKGGNLKHKVAFVPYITASLLIMLVPCPII